MKKMMIVATMVLAVLVVVSAVSAFYLHIGQDKSEIVEAIGQPNYSDWVVDATLGKLERCQWGSERVGGMLVIYFRNGKVIRFETKGKVD